MILITGATGKTGAETAKQLTEAGLNFRAYVRNPDKADHLKKDNIDLAIGDLENRDALLSALQGIERALLIVPNGEHQLELEKQFTDCCVEAGVKHIVKLSSLESVPGTTNPITKMHVASADYIAQSGLDWTLSRPTFFMQNFSNMAAGIKANNQITLPVGQGTVSATDLRDVAAVHVKLLTEDGHAGKNYPMTGPDLLTFDEIAEQFSEVLGRTITYVDMDIGPYRERLAKAGLTQWRIDAVCEEFRAISEGVIDHTTDDIENILCRPPTDLKTFIQDFRHLFED